MVLHLILLHRYCIFYQLKARSPTSEKITIHFTAILALLRWSGTKTLRGIAMHVCVHAGIYMHVYLSTYTQCIIFCLETICILEIY